MKTFEETACIDFMLIANVEFFNNFYKASNFYKAFL